MTFPTRHDKRDHALPECRHKLLTGIVEILKKHDGIKGIFLGGSIATKTEDLFSDIDLRVVVTEEHYDEYVRTKQQLAAQFGDVLLERSNEIAYQVSPDEVVRWRGKVFTYIHETYRRVMRNELYYALTIINHLRSFIVNGWNMEVGRISNDAWDWSKIEGDRSSLEPWQLGLLRGWMSGRDPQEIMKTLQSMIPEIRRLHSVLCKKAGLLHEEEKFDQIVNMVL